MNDDCATGRVAPGASPGAPAAWAPLDANAARRAAYGRVGDAAGAPGLVPGDRPRPPRACPFM